MKKKRIKDEKKRLKEEKKKLKNEEKMSKETQESVLEEKQQPEETVSIDQIDEIEEIAKTEENFNLNSNEGETSGGSSFDKIYDMITKRNDSKSYPDINDISE